jgi:adhesin transport system outer membrane protein
MTNNPATRGAGDGEVHLNREEASLFLRQMIFDGVETQNEVDRQAVCINFCAWGAFSAAENTGLEAVDAYLLVFE